MTRTETVLRWAVRGAIVACAAYLITFVILHAQAATNIYTVTPQVQSAIPW